MDQLWTYIPSTFDCVCMGSLYHCIIACGHLGNGTGHRTVTMAASLLLTNGPARYEAVFHGCGTSPSGGVGLHPSNI